MIEVKVESLGSFASEIGELEKTVTLQEGAAIGDLIAVLIRDLANGQRFKEMVLNEQGKKRKYVLLMLNYNLLYQDPLEERIPDRAKVVFAMPAAGG